MLIFFFVFYFIVGIFVLFLSLDLRLSSPPPLFSLPSRTPHAIVLSITKIEERKGGVGEIEREADREREIEREVIDRGKKSSGNF